MNNLTVFVAEHDGVSVRVTDDKQFSVYDVLVALKVTDKAHAAETLKRISDKYSEVNHFCVNFKFPGRGQRETPVASEEGIYQILMLSPGQKGAEFRKWAATVLRENREENANPELAYNRGRERAVKTWKRQGKSDAEISQQLKAIEVRCHFTDTLKAHGVIEGKHYAMITNEIYRELLGGTASQLKQQRGLAKNARLRDSFSMVDSSANALVEALSAQDIEQNNLNGFEPCRNSAGKAAKRVRKALD